MIRIQRKRTKGWRMPESAVYVGRPSRWANYYQVGQVCFCPDGLHGPMDAASAVKHFRDGIVRWQDVSGWLDPLRDATALACWCPLDQPCHADVLIELLSR